MRLARALEKGAIAAMTDAYKFAHGDMVEKFVMDFELQSHIAGRLDYVTRGGLCMSFYAGGPDELGCGSCRHVARGGGRRCHAGGRLDAGRDVIRTARTQKTIPAQELGILQGVL